MEVKMYGLISDEYLMHYGVKGMKWGVRHDPERVGRKPAKKQNKKKKGLSPKAKKYIKIGAVAAGAVLAVYGLKRVNSYAIYKAIRKATPKNIEGNSRIYKKIPIPEITFDQSILKNAVNNGKAGRDPYEIDYSLLESVNQGINGMYTTDPARSQNCGMCCVSYIMNSLFDVKCSAGVETGLNLETRPGISVPTTGKTINQLLSSFKDVKRTSYNEKVILPRLSKALDKIPNGSTGILMITNNRASHYINYEKTNKGIVTLIDTQSKLSGEMVYNLFKGTYVREVFDFSNAKIGNNVSMLSRMIMK